MILLLILFLLGRRCEKEVKKTYGISGVVFAIIVFIIAEIIGKIAGV